MNIGFSQILWTPLKNSAKAGLYMWWRCGKLWERRFSWFCHQFSLGRRSFKNGRLGPVLSLGCCRRQVCRTGNKGNQKKKTRAISSRPSFVDAFLIWCFALRRARMPALHQDPLVPPLAASRSYRSSLRWSVVRSIPKMRAAACLFPPVRESTRRM